MASNNKQQLLIQELEEFYEQLRGFRDAVEELHTTRKDTGSRERERPRIQEELVRKSGKLKPIVVRLTGKQYGKQFNEEFDVWTEALDAGSYPPSQKWSLGALMDNVNEAIGRLEAEPESEKLFKITPSIESPKAFVAHGGKSAALNKLCAFLEALGVEALVAEAQPSEGRLTEQQVDNYMKQADCAIILATYGHIEDIKTRKKHPRLNVVDELGRCRKVFPDRTILLLEKGVDLSSNDSGIIYEHFTKQNMEKAFIKVAKELRAFGLIRAMKHGE